MLNNIYQQQNVLICRIYLCSSIRRHTFKPGALICNKKKVLYTRICEEESKLVVRRFVISREYLFGEP